MERMENKNKVISSIGWSSATSIVSYFIFFSRTFILVRLLSPQDFGLMALSLLLVTTIKQFSQTGLEQAIIQDNDSSKHTLNTVWTTSIIRGLLFFLLINLLSPFYCQFFGEPEISNVLKVLSLSVLFTGFKNSYVIVSQKELKFRKIFILTLFSQISEVLTTIVLAILYKNVIALAIGHLAGSIIGLLFSFTLFNRRPIIDFQVREFKRLFTFGKWVMSGGAIIFLIINIDTTIIGKILGASMLGFYKIAYRFANFPATDILLTFSKSIYPSFSLVKNDINQLRMYFLTVIQVTSIVILPLMIILGFYAESFIKSFIGTSWAPSIVPLKILIVFGLIRSYASTCGYIFWTLGKPQIQTIISLLQFILILIIIFPLTNNYGISGVALAITIPLLISSVFSFYFVSKELNILFRNYFEYISSALFSMIVMLIIISIFNNHITHLSKFELITTSFFLLFLFYSTLFVFDYFNNSRIKNLLIKIIN